MARIPDVKRLKTEDFPDEYQELMEKVGYSLNTFMDQVRSALNKNINFDNLNQEIKNIEVTVNASGVPTSPTKIRTTINGKVNGLWIGRAQNLTNTLLFPTSGVVISFNEEENGILSITNVTGLQANNKYRLRVLIIGD